MISLICLFFPCIHSQIVTVFPMMAYNVTLAEKLTLVHAMSSELQRVESLMQTDADSSAFSANDVFRNHIRSLHLILSGVYQEIGPLQSALQYYHRSLLAVDYRTHRSERDLWKQRRKLYANSGELKGLVESLTQLKCFLLRIIYFDLLIPCL